MIDHTQAAATQAEARLADLSRAQAGIEADRAAVLASAAAEAEAARDVILAEARHRARKHTADAERIAAQTLETARKAQAGQAADLSVDIAARLLGQLAGPEVQAGFLARLLSAISDMPAADRAALSAPGATVDLVSPVEVSDAAQASITEALRAVLGTPPPLRLILDPDLIAGMDLRSAHFRLYNSWRADLAEIRKALQDAA